MNTENSEIETDTPETPPEKTGAGESGPGISRPEKARQEESTSPESKSRRSGTGMAFLAFCISLLALLGTAWMWWLDQSSTEVEEQRVFTELGRLENNDNELSLKLNQIRDEIDSLAAGDAGVEVQALRQRLEADRSKLAGAERAINEQLNLTRSLQTAADSMQGRLQAAEAALTGLSTRELDAGGELDIAEVDYLLRLANERLKLFSDPAAADQALEVADMHLAALDNPMYLGVRQDIAQARRELATVEIPDYLEIASQLDSIQVEVASLPFSEGDPVPQKQDAAQAEGWWAKVKSVFSNLVTIRRSTDDENRRISLQDKDYIRQRVWLQLEIAHLSLMQRDQNAFRVSLERVRESLSTWFDTGEKRYQAVRQDIDQLMTLEVQLDVPDITAPWSTLRLLRANQARPGKAPVPAPEPELEPELEPEPEPAPEPESPAGSASEPETETAGEAEGE